MSCFFRSSIRFLCFLMLIGLTACRPAAEAPAPEPEAQPATDPSTPIWSVTEGIDTPESVYIDADSNSIFVSQIVGDPGAADGIGRIVQLGMDGTLIDSEWASGLNAPKGLRSDAGVLWVADMSTVIGFEIATGAEVVRIEIDGSQFLNDVAVGSDGTVYVSDFTANRIYGIQDGNVTVVAEGEQLEFPNGLLVEGDRLIVGGWGEPAADFSTEVPGRLYALDLETGEKTLITPEPFANIDGVESDGSGGYVITDYLAGQILHVAANGTVTEVVGFGPGTADLAFVAETGTAIVPHMNENTISAYDLSGVLN